MIARSLDGYSIIIKGPSNIQRCTLSHVVVYILKNFYYVVTLLYLCFPRDKVFMF